MNLKGIRIVLVATTHPGNIGSTARAMKTMGLSRLYLVNPNLEPYRKAHEMASGAYDVLREAVVVESLAEALAGCRLICATSARPRDIALPGLSPKSLAELVAKEEDNSEVAIVFGREHAGLTNEELLCCHYHVHIPSDPNFSSLNLSQAVQIIAYELRMSLLAPEIVIETRKDAYATAEDVERFYTHLEEVLIKIEFLDPDNPRRLLQRIRRLFNRVRLEQMEINLLRGILTQIMRL